MKIEDYVACPRMGHGVYKYGKITINHWFRRETGVIIFSLDSWHWFRLDTGFEFAPQHNSDINNAAHAFAARENFKEC